MKKVFISGFVGFALIIAAFFGGMLAANPTSSDEYRSLEKDLADAKATAAQTQGELVAAQSDLADSEANLAESESKVDALTSEAVAAGEAAGEPALSGGAAVAARNFELGVRIRSKECFGSAGCSLDVQVTPAYVGKQDVSTGSWELTYELRGGEDGPVVETMTLIDGTFSFPEEQFVSTASSTSRVTAVVTAVYSLD